MAGLAGSSCPALGLFGGRGGELCDFFGACRKNRAVPVRPLGRPRGGAHRASGIYRRGLARPLAGRSPEPALRVSCLRALRSVERASVQSEQAADRSLRQGVARAASLGRRGLRLSTWEPAGGPVV